MQKQGDNLHRKTDKDRRNDGGAPGGATKKDVRREYLRLDKLDDEKSLTKGPGNSRLDEVHHVHAYIGPYAFNEDARSDKQATEEVEPTATSGSDHSDGESDQDASTDTVNGNSELNGQFAEIVPSAPTGKTPVKKNTTLSSVPNGDMFDPVENILDFISRPVPKNLTVNCRVTRNRKGVDKNLHPSYFMHMERDDEKRVFLLAGRRRKKSATSNYLISVDPCDLARTSDAYVAKVRSNFVGTQFTIYDSGCSPKGKHNLRFANSDLRHELATATYETNVLGFKGPRRMTVVIPQISDNDERIRFCPMSEGDSMTARYKRGQMECLLELRNKTPVWNEDTQSYVLNFHGRVTQASVKNFQLVRTNDVDNVVMQFGRVADDVFTLDFTYPLCAIQAFGIALTSFDSKLACE